MEADFGLYVDQIRTIRHEIVFFLLFFWNLRPRKHIFSVSSSLYAAFDILAAQQPNSAATFDFEHFRGPRGLLDSFFFNLRPSKHENQHLTRCVVPFHQNFIFEQPFWPQSCFGSLSVNIRESTSDFLILEIKMRRLSCGGNLHPERAHGT